MSRLNDGLRATDSPSLRAEGKAMHHCLGSFPMHHELAAKGHFYAFALTKPARLTLAVIFDEQTKRWGLYDLKGHSNTDPDESAAGIADALLQRFQKTMTSSTRLGPGGG